MTLPAITVVTPTLNQASFIRQTIDSVLAQGYPALEYRVLDGGSSDGTLDILASYGRRISWQSAPDHGQTDAINRGWSIANGEILAWLNSDDFYLPGALEKVGQYFANHPEVDWLYGDCFLVDTLGQKTGIYATRPYNYLDLVRETHDFIPQPATFIRRRVFEILGPLDKSLHYVLDFDYWLRAGLHFRASYLSHPFAALRLHDSAKSTSQLDRFSQELVTTYIHYFENRALPDEIRAIERHAMSNIYLRAADCAFWGGNLRESRGYALKSFALRPMRLRRLWLYLVLGPIGRSLAGHILPNPYTGPSGGYP